MQQCLKPAAGTARARVVAPELLEKLLVPFHDAMSAFDPGLGRVALPTLARGLETRTGRGVWLCASWHTSIELAPMGGRRIIARCPGVWGGICTRACAARRRTALPRLRRASTRSWREKPAAAIRAQRRVRLHLKFASGDTTDATRSGCHPDRGSLRGHSQAASLAPTQPLRLSP